jgi:CheY-like chemotaxis protein
MALNGRLEEMNLLEILQIVAFSKKTGTLEVRARLASGSILFRNGRVLSAFSSSTAAAARELARKPGGAGAQAALEALVSASLRELVPLREGRFEFRLLRSLPSQWGGLDASGFLLSDGIDPQSILLGLARDIDEARRDSADLLESGGAIDAAPSELRVLVVDDEPLVLKTVASELGGAGLLVETATGPAEAFERISGREDLAQGSLIVVVDAAMPTSNGERLDGGFELLERLASIVPAPTVLLVVETLPAAARARAKHFGVRKTLFKPTLTKLDPEEYESDLRSFAAVLRGEIAAIALEARNLPEEPPEEPQLNHEAIFDFLRTLTDRLAAPAQGITRMILRVASKYAERAVLFLVKQGRASGLAGLHRGRPTPSVVAEVRAIAFELQQVQPFAEAVYSKKPVRIADGREPFLPLLDPGRAREHALLPLLHNHEVLAILYCDNPVTGAPLSKLSGLQLFLVQAGMALENASLHRRLRSMERKYSLEDQGPLTQELTPIVRERL